MLNKTTFVKPLSELKLLELRPVKVEPPNWELLYNTEPVHELLLALLSKKFGPISSSRSPELAPP